MKILHVGKFYPPVEGGIEAVVSQLCEGTAGTWQVDVIVANDRSRTVRERRAGVRIARVAALGRVASVSICPTLPAYLWRSRYDCVILHEPNPLAACSLLLRTPGPSLIVWHHSDIGRPRWARVAYPVLQRALYRRAACVIVSSPRLAKTSRVVSSARCVAVIPYGIELGPEADSGTRAGEAAGGHHAGGPHFLFVGRLVYYKGLDVLLRAMTSCDGVLRIVGDGPERRFLQSRIHELGLGSRVELMGHLSDEEVLRCYRDCDVFVLPSTETTEAFGVVQIEAMAAARPVISTNLPTGVPWVNQDGVTGLIVPPGDAAALASAMNRLGQDEALRRRMGLSARERAVREFSAERMISRFRDLVEQVVFGLPAGIRVSARRWS